MGQARVFVGTAKYTPLRVTISPAKLEIGVNNGPIQLTAQVTTAKGKPVTNARLSWKAFPRHIGSIDQNGFFTPGMHTGRGIITVSAKTQTGTGSVQVSVTVGEGEIGREGHKRFIISVSGATRLKVSSPTEFTVI